jgi:hypothetical protein
MPEFKDRGPGTYPSKFVALDENYEITDKETNEQVIRWRWVFQEVADPTTMGEMDTLTTPGFRPRSNGLKFFTGMLGRPPQPGDNTDDLIGQVFDVTYGPNMNGRLTITNVIKSMKPPTMSASDELRAGREGRQHAADLKAAQEAETATFRGTEVPVTDPDPNTDELPF